MFIGSNPIDFSIPPLRTKRCWHSCSAYSSWTCLMVAQEVIFWLPRIVSWSRYGNLIYSCPVLGKLSEFPWDHSAFPCCITFTDLSGEDHVFIMSQLHGVQMMPIVLAPWKDHNQDQWSPHLLPSRSHQGFGHGTHQCDRVASPHLVWCVILCLYPKLMPLQ